MDIVFNPCEPLVLDVVPKDPALLADIESAAALWNALLQARLTVAATQDAPILPIEFEDASPISFGQYDDEAARIYVNQNLNSEKRTISAAHEIGHAFGLFHVDGQKRSSVMNRGNLTVPPNEQDGQDVGALWGQCL